MVVQFFGRLLARFAILIPGLVIAYFGVSDIWPYFNNRLPAGWALLATYILCAYILIPAAIRIYRIFIRPSHLPIYSVTPDGLASDPLNIAIIGTRRELINTMNKIGWHQADPRTLKNIFHMGVSIIFGKTYNSAPVSNLYLFGRKQDLAFQLTRKGSSSHRHHVRFWATTFEKKDGELDVKSIHWHHRDRHVFGDNLLWVGAASLDSGIALIRHNFQFTHMIDPDTNLERELIVKQLRSKKLLSKVSYVHLDDPYKLINRVIKGYLHTDGRMAVVDLKRPFIKRLKALAD